MQVAEGHISSHIRSNALQFLKSDAFSLRDIALFDKGADFRKTFSGIGIYSVAQTA